MQDSLSKSFFFPILSHQLLEIERSGAFVARLPCPSARENAAFVLQPGMEATMVEEDIQLRLFVVTDRMRVGWKRRSPFSWASTVY